MFTLPPQVDKSLGLLPSDFPLVIVEVWPDCWDAILVFDAMTTQWRTGFNGLVGLDYTALPVVHESLGIPRTPDLFADVRTMEMAVIEMMGERNGN